MATNFHDAVTETYNAASTAGPTLPGLWFGEAPDDTARVYPYAILGKVTEHPNYGSAGSSEYMTADATLTVYGKTADEARAAATLIRAALPPSSLTITGKAVRLYQGEYSEDKTGTRGPQGEYVFAAVIPLNAEIS